MSTIRQNLNAQYIGLIRSPRLNPSVVGNITATNRANTMITPRSSPPALPVTSNGEITMLITPGVEIIAAAAPQTINRET